MTVTEPWICPTCNCNVSTLYCPACGERPLNQRDLTLGGLAVQIAQSLSDIDGRLLNSFMLKFESKTRSAKRKEIVKLHRPY
jgi:hypothetical protein